ncbi:MAG: hypothetical protein IPI98_02625 [Chitinophagaceae bacterium]|nr:hypothetical protein [Chitinophagaceae bacterium]
MKLKLILIIILLMPISVCFSQNFAPTKSNLLDSVKSNTSDTMYSPAFTQQASAHSFQFTKTGATTLSVTTYLQGTVNGVDWDIQKQDTISFATGATTVTRTILKDRPAYIKYRAISVGGGSGSGKMKGYATYKRY